MPQFFTPLTEPVGAIWCLMVLGVLWLLGHRQWRSAIWLGFPTVLIFIVGSTPLAEKLVASEERLWAGEAEVEKAAGREQKVEIGNRQSSITNDSPISAFNLQPSAFAFDAVVALGGGERVSQQDLLGFAMTDAGSRVLTAVQLVRSGQAKTLVLGGSWPLADQQNVPSMNPLQDWVTSWGLVGGAVTNLGICINTHDEAVAFRKMAQGHGWLKVILVTSAMHMRRAVALFQQQGLAVTPVAADFQVLGVPPEPFSLFPRQHRFFLLSLYWHEKIGWWVYRARRWV